MGDTQVKTLQATVVLAVVLVGLTACGNSTGSGASSGSGGAGNAAVQACKKAGGTTAQAIACLEAHGVLPVLRPQR